MGRGEGRSRNVGIGNDFGVNSLQGCLELRAQLDFLVSWTVLYGRGVCTSTIYSAGRVNGLERSETRGWPRRQTAPVQLANVNREYSVHGGCYRSVAYV